MQTAKTIKIEKSGVVSIETGCSSDIKVNSDYIIGELSGLVDKAKPEVDCNGCFAGKVKIEIEFLGDMEDGRNG